MVVHFNFHKELCVGCGSCVIACINENKIDVDIETPHRTLGKNERVFDGVVEIAYFSTACMHCEDAPCAERCPKSCYSIDEETGVVVLDNSNCVGCGLCGRVCDFDAIHFGADRKAIKCNGCIHRLKDREKPRIPMCVLACPRHAITIDDKDDVRKGGRDELRRELKIFNHCGEKGEGNCTRRQ